MPKPPRRVLPAIVLAQLAGTSSWFAVNAVMPDLQRSFGWPPASVASLTSAVQLGFIVGALVFALLSIADRFSARRVFLVCAIACALCTLMSMRVAASFASLWTWRALTGFCLAGIYPVGMKLAAMWFPRGLGAALGLLVGALVLGNSPYITNLLAGKHVFSPLMGSGAVDIIVIDSVAALTPRAEIEGEMGDSKMGLQARLMSQALRKLTATIGRTNCCLVFINQLREKIGVMFGNPETTTGGNALKFYASIRLDIRKSGSAIKDKDGNFTGNHVKVKVVKNKLAPPFRVAEFDLVFGEGISKVGEIVDLGTDLDIIQKSGSWYSYNGTKIAQGREAAKVFIHDNPEMADEIELEIRKRIQDAPVKIEPLTSDEDDD